MADKPDAVPPVPDTLVSDAAGAGDPALGGPPTLPGGPPTMPVMPVIPVMPTVIGRAADAASSVPPAMPGAEVLLAVRAPLPGGRYVLGAEIARGGMGRVVDATDTTLDRTVALKEALTRDSDSLRRFDRETRITAQLEHPSIVPVYDAGIAPSGARFYVMRKVSGRPLERLVASAATLNERLALIPHIVDSAQAIAHAHERHIVHRDIKPSNILVGDLGETVVIDWGLAKVIGEPDETDATHVPLGRPLVDLSDALKTRAGVVYGTPGFMAPELLRGAPVNEGCDVYALGATLYHLLSRRPPHHAKTAEDMMKAAVAAPPTPIRQEVEGVPPELADIVDKALAHDPAVRYANARALAEDLQRFLTGRLVAAHHYSPRERVARFIRKNRGVSAAVAALVVVGTVAMVRIVIERDRADAAARTAILERTSAVRRAEELTLARARDNVDTNPTKSVAMLKPLAQRYWREVRAIAAAAHAGGVAWGIHTSKHTRSLEMSGDGRRALSAGSDGVIRLHDLAARTDLTLAELHAPVMARFAGAGDQVVAWHDQAVAIIDARTGAARELRAAAPIADLEIADATAYWVDDHHELWRLELADAAADPVAVDEPILGLTASPDGRWLALTGEHHVYLLDRTRPAEPPAEMVFGTARAIGWAADSGHMVALVERGAIDFTMRPAPAVVHRMTAVDGQLVAHSGRHMYIVGDTDVAAITRTDRDMGPPERRPLRGTAVGVAVARGGAVVVAATGGLTVLSDDGDGDHLLAVQGAHVEAVVARPSSPYVIAQLEDRLLVWNLDDIQPRRLADRPAAGALFAGSNQVIVGGPDDAPAQAIDVATGAARPLGEWPGLTAVAAAEGGATTAILDAEHRVHLIAATAAGPAPIAVPGESSPPTAFELAGFATPDKLVLATAAGAIDLQDLANHRRVRLITGRAPLLGLAWGRGRHPWVAAAFADGMLWRKNLVTGVEATAARVPRLDRAHAVRSDTRLLVAGDGATWFVHDRELHAWTAGGALERLAVLPKPIDDLGEAGPDHVLAFATDATIYGVALDGSGAEVQVEEAMPSIEATGGAMSPETGLLVVLERGAIVVVDPLVRQRWTLASPDRVAFDRLAIAPRGDRVLACSATGLLVWTIGLPANPDDTARWLDAMTNAVDDPSPVGLGWR